MNPINIAITLFKVFTARKSADVNIGNSKQWYQSKGITGSVGSIVILVGMLFGLDLSGYGTEIGVAWDQLALAAADITALYTSGRALIGRIKADSKINQG